MERRHGLARLAVRRFDESRAQGLVAAEDLVQGALQGSHVELSEEAELHRQVVDRRARLQAVDEPEPLLGERQRKPDVPRRPPDRGSLWSADRSGLLDHRCQRAELGGLEEGAQRQLHSEGLAHP